MVYSDFLPRGWIDMFANASGDDATAANLTSATTVHGGATVIEVSNLETNKLVAFGHPKGGLAIPGYDTLRFYIHGGAAGGQQLTVQVVNDDASVTEPLEVTAQAGAWTAVDIPLASQLNPLNVYIIRFWNLTGETLPTFYLDDLGFVNATGAPPPPPSTAAGPHLSVDSARDRHPISPYIYGMNAPDEALAQELHLPVNRWGGNQTSTYNWQNDTYNTGFDWFYENISNSPLASLPDGSSANRFIEQNRRTATASLVTLPMIGWVAKRWKGDHPFDCAFKQSVYGTQQRADWEYDPDCGNGVLADGTQVINDPNDIAIPVGPAFVGDWVSDLRSRYGTAAEGGVSFYALDNEPMLWNSTHNAIRNTPLSTDELIDLTYAYAPVVKAVDPSAKIFGPVFWGWCAYFYSAVDNCTNNGTADYQAHGSIPLVAWYLQKMRAYEQQHGVRILDYLDLHGYPNSAGVYSSVLGNRSTQALRLRSTRSLWDPTYQDESWVPAAVQLIPRMRDWVAAHYPGTKLAITEYNWGAMGYMNGALAQADSLGIFGREGLDLATIWDAPKKTQPGAMAFRMYLNYDGHGATFGDTGVHAESADQEKLAVYAAQQGSKLTLMVVNKTAVALSSPVALAGFRPAATAQVYRYSAAHLAGIVREADQGLTDSGFTGVFPPSSITLVVADQADAPATSTLAIAKAGTGQGRVVSNPDGIDCGVLCSVDFPWGGSVTLAAYPSPGSVFAGWGDACSGTGSCVVTLDDPQSVTATFTLNHYTLTVAQAGTGSGTVGGGGTYAYRTEVTPTATAATGSTFTGWSPANCAGAFALTADTTCTATFTRNGYVITATAKPVAGGTVICTPNPVPRGGSSTCIATANAGYNFSAFSGACTGASCVLSNVTAAKAVTATFTRNTYAITTTASPAGGGTVSCTPNPVGYGGSSTCTARANTGYLFSAFSGDCTGATCALSNVSAATAVTATFTRKRYAITATAKPAAGGTVSCTPNPVDYGGGSICTATANTGYTFRVFSGACTGSNCALSNVTAAKAVTATFTPAP